MTPSWVYDEVTKLGLLVNMIICLDGSVYGAPLSSPWLQLSPIHWGLLFGLCMFC